MTPFSPDPKGTVLIDVALTSANVQVYPERTSISVRVFNDGSATAWISFGDSTVTASATTGIPIGSKESIILTLQNTGSGPLYVAAIAAAGTGKIYFTPGRGGV